MLQIFNNWREAMVTNKTKPRSNKICRKHPFVINFVDIFFKQAVNCNLDYKARQFQSYLKYQQ